MITAEDKEFLRLAFRAAWMSRDPSTQNGSVLVTRSGVRVYEYNHFPSGVRYSEDRLQRPLKYSYIEHAERNAIFCAARDGCQTYGATLYCPWFACADCARAIIQAGIVRVVGYDAGELDDISRWGDSVRIGREMLAEAGVEMEWFKGRLFAEHEGFRVLRDGKHFNP